MFSFFVESEFFELGDVPLLHVITKLAQGIRLPRKIYGILFNDKFISPNSGKTKLWQNISKRVFYP
jgi:hypothetical protein